MPTINDWLSVASKRLIDSSTPKLDSEILLASALDRNRTYLVAHGDEVLDKNALAIANELLDKRLAGRPIAYILNFKEFYGRNFMVNQNVLIPRPESEAIIDLLKSINDPYVKKLADIGSGSGCLGITAKLEIQDLDVTLIDISNDALDIAKRNAQNLQAQVNFLKNNLLEGIENNFEIIIANLPYVDKSWPISLETKYEPEIALFANNNGLDLIYQLIEQSRAKYLILESDPRQQNDIIEYAKNHGLSLINRTNFVLLLQSNRYTRTGK